MTGLDMFEDTFVADDEVYRRHPIRHFLFRLFLIVLVLAVAAACYVWRYQPLSYGGAYGARGDQVRETESAGGSSVVTYSAGERFEMIFSIRNTGRLPVRVTAIPDSELAPVVSSYDVALLPAGVTGYDSNDAGPFRAFTLEPGESRLLDLSYAFTDCGAPASAGNRAVRTQRVHYRLAGRLGRVADVPLGEPLVIRRLPAC